LKNTHRFSHRICISWKSKEFIFFATIFPTFPIFMRIKTQNKGLSFSMTIEIKNLRSPRLLLLLQRRFFSHCSHRRPPVLVVVAATFWDHRRNADSSARSFFDAASSGTVLADVVQFSPTTPLSLRRSRLGMSSSPLNQNLFLFFAL